MRNFKIKQLSLALGVTLGCAVTLPDATAAAIGELTVGSYLGQPFKAQIALKAEPDEEIGESCISLAKPPKPSDGMLPYLSKARLSVEKSAKGQLINVTTTSPMHEPLLRLIVQMECSDRGKFVREFTVLLDPPEYGGTVAAPLVATSPEQPTALPASPASKRAIRTGSRIDTVPGDTLEGIAQAFYPHSTKNQRRLMRAIVRANPELFPDGATDAALPVGKALLVPQLPPPRPETQTKSPEPRSAARSTPSDQQAVEAPKADAGGFRLKLSASVLDVSASGRITEEERARLREKQLLLDADDQVANILALKDRVKQLESELADMRLKLSTQIVPGGEQKPGAPQTAPAAEAPMSLPQVATAPASSSAEFTPYLIAAAASLGGFLAFLGLRRRRKRQEAQYYSQLEHELEPSLVESKTLQPEPAAAVQPAQQPVSAVPPGVTVAPPQKAIHEGAEDRYYDPSSIFKQAEEGITLTELDSVIEEADLYLIYGWVQKAIDLLEQHIEKNKAEPQPRMMLFDIYHSKGEKKPFEQLAQQFKTIFGEESDLWKKVQAIGHEFDPDNPLYLKGKPSAADYEPPAAGAQSALTGADTVEPEERGEALPDVIEWGNLFTEKPASPSGEDAAPAEDVALAGLDLGSPDDLLPPFRDLDAAGASEKPPALNSADEDVPLKHRMKGN